MWWWGFNIGFKPCDDGDLILGLNHLMMGFNIVFMFSNDRDLFNIGFKPSDYGDLILGVSDAGDLILHVNYLMLGI